MTEQPVVETTGRKQSAAEFLPVVYFYCHRFCNTLPIIGFTMGGVKA
jgi:hypothetical protein